jgi:RNA polymerase sigma factor (sigma-70 family)
VAAIHPLTDGLHSAANKARRMSERSEGEARRADGSLDWSQLMVRAQTGDRLAYRRLLEDITPYLRSLVARHPMLVGELEDVVQDVLLTVHAIRHAYDPGRPFGPWLLAIARRRIVDRLRRRGSRAAEVPLGPEHETIVAESTNLYPLLSETRALRDAIASLPAGQRRAILLLKLRGLSLKEAALESGLSIAALKVASHRALKALRAMLAERI